jgi:hypothetical protein
MHLVRHASAAAAVLLCILLVACSAAPAPSRDSDNPSAMQPAPPPPKHAKPAEPHPLPPKPIPVPELAYKHLHLPGQPTDGSQAAVQPPPPTDEQILEAELAKLKKGNLAYSTPTSMKTGETAHVVARIGGDGVPIATLQQGMPVDAGQKISLAGTPVSSRMKMTLKGADFDITTLSSEEQIVAGSSPTQWEWDIVPRHSGNLRLHLAAVVELNGIARDFTSVDRDIAVLVDPIDVAKTFVATNWQWLIASFITVCGAVWKYLSSRKKTAPPA